MEIRELVDKYFDGETSSAEEDVLQTYFSENQVSKELQAEQDYFSALSQLREKSTAKNAYRHTELVSVSPANTHVARGLRVKPAMTKIRFIPLSAAAAIAGLILVSVFYFYAHHQEDYLIVNGVKTNNKEQMEAVFYASLESAKMETNDIWEILKD